MEPKHILLVEDNEGDIFLITEALESAKLITKLSVVKDGKQAMDFLVRAKGFADAARPDMVLLDINLPKKNGHQVLKFIKDNDDLRQIPVIILTTSSSPADINEAYRNYVNCFITKPVDADNFLDLITTIEKFWISIANLPDNNS
ncbi:response regulator [Daejeonella sp.]|uniref:response regulator n=1 Tax=Daejeonella sp. TaxID=2805397 RepID=UPI0030C5D89A